MTPPALPITRRPRRARRAGAAPGASTGSARLSTAPPGRRAAPARASAASATCPPRIVNRHDLADAVAARDPHGQRRARLEPLAADELVEDQRLRALAGPRAPRLARGSRAPLQVTSTRSRPSRSTSTSPTSSRHRVIAARTAGRRSGRRRTGRRPRRSPRRPCSRASPSRPGGSAPCRRRSRSRRGKPSRSRSQVDVVGAVAVLVDAVAGPVEGARLRRRGEVVAVERLVDAVPVAVGLEVREAVGVLAREGDVDVVRDDDVVARRAVDRVREAVARGRSCRSRRRPKIGRTRRGRRCGPSPAPPVRSLRPSSPVMMSSPLPPKMPSMPSSRSFSPERRSPSLRTPSRTTITSSVWSA